VGTTERIKQTNIFGELIAINISAAKGTTKREVAEVEFIENFGIKNDAHGGSYREISVLCFEDIDEFSTSNKYTLINGDFGENLIVSGISFENIEVGRKLRVGSTLTEIIQIGKVCHNGCVIRETIGYCIMPDKGFFVKVINGGIVKKGNKVELIFD